MSATRWGEQPLTSMGVYLPTCPFRGTAGSTFSASICARRPCLGGSGDCRRRNISRFRHRCRPRDRADIGVRVPVHHRNRCSRRTGPLSGVVHRHGPGAADPVRRRAAVVSVLHRESWYRRQGHSSERRDPAGQPFSADASRIGSGDCSRSSTDLPEEAGDPRTCRGRYTREARPRQGQARIAHPCAVQGRPCPRARGSHSPSRDGCTRLQGRRTQPNERISGSSAEKRNGRAERRPPGPSGTDRASVRPARGRSVPSRSNSS